MCCQCCHMLHTRSIWKRSECAYVCACDTFILWGSAKVALGPYSGFHLHWHRISWAALVFHKICSCLNSTVCKVVPIFGFPVLRMSSCFTLPEEYKTTKEVSGPTRSHFSHIGGEIKLLDMLFVSLAEEVYRLSHPCVAAWLCEDKAWNGRFTYNCPCRQHSLTHRVCFECRKTALNTSPPPVLKPSPLAAQRTNAYMM